MPRKIPMAFFTKIKKKVHMELQKTPNIKNYQERGVVIFYLVNYRRGEGEKKRQRKQ